MGIFKAAVYATVFSTARDIQRSSEHYDNHRANSAASRATAPLFRTSPPPTPQQVADYLAMKADRATSPERAAAYRHQRAAIRAGHPYHVTASINTGRINIKLIPRPPVTADISQSALRAAYNNR